MKRTPICLALGLITINVLAAGSGYSSSRTVQPALGYHHAEPRPSWVSVSRQTIPAGAVVGGSLLNKDAVYICRANYRGNLHIGKYIAGRCYIAANKHEITSNTFEVLTSVAPIAWQEGSYGSKPLHAFPGGRNKHHTLYICQAEYANSTHPGQLIDKHCHFGFNGEEFMTPYYNMLAIASS